MKNSVKEVVELLESHFPLHYQESYDNSGLIVGQKDMLVSGMLLSLDLTEEVLQEAIDRGFNFILTHHPFIFKGLKNFTGKNAQQRILAKAIKNDIAIYASHTCADSVIEGVSGQMAHRLGLKSTKILRPHTTLLSKLVIYTPSSHQDVVREAIHSVGAGKIGDYDCCSFSSSGEGRFRALDLAVPFVGKINQLHTQSEQRIETIIERALIAPTLAAVRSVHPYQEMAYDVIAMDIAHPRAGFGIVGDLEQEMEVSDFMAMLGKAFSLKVIKHTKGKSKKVSRVALCGGSGADLVGDAIGSGAHIYITGDIKYHAFLDHGDQIILADIGHFESEAVILDHFYDIVTKKITTFAAAKADKISNPINYYTTL